MATTEYIAALRVIDEQLAEIDRQLQEYNRLADERAKLVAARSSLLTLIPPTNGEAATVQGHRPMQTVMEGVRAARGRRTARHAMIDLLRRTRRPADHDALLKAVVDENLMTEAFEKNAVQAVYQTMYAARKDKIPVDRLPTGEWVWRGE